MDILGSSVFQDLPLSLRTSYCVKADMIIH